MNNPFQKAKAVLQELLTHGFKAYIVGGSVRDYLRGTPVHDIDIATSATPEQVMAIFPKTFPIGIQHGTILVRMDYENYEVTTFRSESDYKDFRHPDHVKFETSIDKDLERRDFTINAMAMDINGKIIDPYNGQSDLKKGILMTVGSAEERFKEDPLRMLRAVRFVSTLNLTADNELKKAMKQTTPLIKHLALERIREEYTKLLAGKWLNRGIELLVETRLADYLPMNNLKRESLRELGSISFRTLQSDFERWALFLIVSGCREPITFLKSWRFSKQAQTKVVTLFECYFRQKDKSWDAFSIYRSGVDVAVAVERIKVALGMSSGQFEQIQKLWARLPLKVRSELAVNGSDLCDWLNKEGGPWTGRLLEEIEMSVVLGLLKNEQEAIRRWVWHQQNKKS